MYRRILVGIDGSPGATAALRRAILLAREPAVTLYVVAVEEHLPRFAATVGETEDARQEREAYFGKVIDDAKKLAADMNVEIAWETVRGNPPKILVDRARELDCDLIVVGHTRHVWGNLLGSTADRVVDHAHCDVLVVR